MDKDNVTLPQPEQNQHPSPTNTGAVAAGHRPARTGVKTILRRPKPSASVQGDSLGPLPFVIGVTGHRDVRPQDVAALEEKVQSILDSLRAACPNTPLVLLSPLAEGADRVVARVALRSGARLISPLPFAYDEYMLDFQEPEVRTEFEEMLAKADNVLEMPLLDGTTPENIQDPQRRADQYALVGAFVVRQCQLLIALWNGIPATVGGGGTGEIVEFMRNGIPSRFEDILAEASYLPRGPLDRVETGPVYHIVTPRQSKDQVEGGAPLALIRYFTHDHDGTSVKLHGIASEDSGIHAAETTFTRILSNMDRFNQEAAEIEKDDTLRGRREVNAGYLYPEDEKKNLPPLIWDLRSHYAIADTLAQRYQKETFDILKVLCILVFCSLLSFELTAKLAPNSPGLEFLFPGFLLVAYVVWNMTVRRGAWQDRYQDYRALAEGLRVEFFWHLAGLPTSVSDHYLRRQKGELEWIRIAVRNLGSECISPVPERPPEEDEESRYRTSQVLTRWVDDQVRYFERATGRDEHELKRFEKCVQVLLISGPVIATLIGLVGIIPSPLGEFLHHSPLLHKLLIILVFVLAGVAGILHTFMDRRALPQQVKQYERMFALFSVAKRRLDIAFGAGDEIEVRRLLLELGRESLAENGDWVLLHRERPVDVPHAG